MFRADAIGRLADADQKKLQTMGLETDADVKSLPDPVIKVINYARADEGNPGSNIDLGSIFASGLMKDKQESLDEMKANYVSIDKFIEVGLGVMKQERVKLKAMYTE